MEKTTLPSDGNSKERLKNEILHELYGVKQREGKKKLSWGSATVTVVLILLTLLSVTQAVQSANILNKIKSGQIKSSGGASSSAPLPSSLDNLPNMVGGC